MASLQEYAAGSPETRESDAAVAHSVAQLQETLNAQKSFQKHVSALASRTSLSPEDVMAEAVRFADRHQEAFHDFIYKGELANPARRSASTKQLNTILVMTLMLSLLIALIVVLAGR
jgi:hypothetical protein